MIRQEHLDLVGLHLAAENEHRLEDTLATLHPECVFEDVAMQRVYRGREGAREYYTAWWSAFEVVVQGKKRHFTDEGTSDRRDELHRQACGEFPRHSSF